MNNDIFDELVKWKDIENGKRLPLIIQSHKYAGKTKLIKRFADSQFSNYVYVNFRERIYDLFYQTIPPQMLLELLSIFSSQRIVPGKTLIVFDNIQCMPSALNSVVLFKDCAPQYHICCIRNYLIHSFKSDNKNVRILDRKGSRWTSNLKVNS